MMIGYFCFPFYDLPISFVFIFSPATHAFFPSSIVSFVKREKFALFLLKSATDILNHFEFSLLLLQFQEFLF